MPHVAASGGLAAALALAVLWFFNEEEPPALPVAYVVCGGDYRSDSRAYRVDLLAGELTSVSEPIKWLGQPHHLAYDPIHSRLYIASMNKKWSPPMWPITALRARGGEFEVARRFPTNRENNLLKKALAGEAPPPRRMMAKPMREAYTVIVSPDGSELYVSYGRLSDTGMLLQAWDADTGEILRGMPSFIPRHATWSPDGNHVASIWPSHGRKINEDGEVVAEANKGGVSIINTQTGGKSLLRHLESNKGMHPPWGHIEEPLIYLFYWNAGLGEVGVYDRDTGEVISQLEVHRLTGLDMGDNPDIAVLEGGRLIAVSTAKRMTADDSLSPVSVAEQEQGYVVLIDVLEQREITRTRVGARCTNAVVAYE